MGCFLKDKKKFTVTNVFQDILDKSNRKPNKIWVDKESEFYNWSKKSSLQDNDGEISLMHNDKNSFVAERFISRGGCRISKKLAKISK